VDAAGPRRGCKTMVWIKYQTQQMHVASCNRAHGRDLSWMKPAAHIWNPVRIMPKSTKSGNDMPYLMSRRTGEEMRNVDPTEKETAITY
jgi:hypothetical protein